ncbi:MAG TPA: hypothetical protein VJ343_01920 [archaeon]|nr:hypothetical protein [archaeon]
MKGVTDRILYFVVLLILLFFLVVLYLVVATDFIKRVLIGGI